VDFIGSGWAYPAHTDPTGSVALASGDRRIAESIRLILATAPGERPMRPEFGCAIHDLVFAPADASTAGTIAHEVRRALDRWEPRITVDDVGIDFTEADRGRLLVSIRYRLLDTNSERNLVFPFYVLPPDRPTGPEPASEAMAVEVVPGRAALAAGGG